MMTPEETVARRLLDTPVSGLVGGRVWINFLPQSPTLPAIVVQLIDEVRTAHLRGVTALTTSRVQVDIYTDARVAGAYDLANTIMGAVDAALQPEPFAVTDGVEVRAALPTGRLPPGYQPAELNQTRLLQDYLVSWRPPRTVH
jgi:hypothetical protein